MRGNGNSKRMKRIHSVCGDRSDGYCHGSPACPGRVSEEVSRLPEEMLSPNRLEQGWMGGMDGWWMGVDGQPTHARIIMDSLPIHPPERLSGARARDPCKSIA